MLKRRFVFLAIVSLVMNFSLLGLRPLWDPSEARYGEVVREMAERGDWITPTFLYVPHLSKPPLTYWLGAAAIKVFGVTEFAVRFFSALALTVTVWTTYGIGRLFFNSERSFHAALMLQTMVLFYAMGQILLTDMILTMWVMLSIAGALLTWQTGRQIGVWIFWLAAALGFLTKGPVGLVLPVLVLVAGRFALKPSYRMNWIHVVLGAVVFLIVVAPWFILAAHRHPGLWRYFIVRETAERMLSDIHRRAKPFWYYPVVMVYGPLPWTYWVFREMWMVAKRGWYPAGRDLRAGRFFALWVVVVYVFFSLLVSKMAYYLLPLFPACALLGSRAVGCWSQRARLWAFGSTIAVFLAVNLIMAFMPYSSKNLYPFVLRIKSDPRPAVVFGYKDHWPSLAFYLGRRLVPVDVDMRLYTGEEAKEYQYTKEQMCDYLRSGGRAYVFCRRRDMEDFNEFYPRLKPVLKSERRALFFQEGRYMAPVLKGRGGDSKSG